MAQSLSGTQTGQYRLLLNLVRGACLSQNGPAISAVTIGFVLSSEFDDAAVRSAARVVQRLAEEYHFRAEVTCTGRALSIRVTPADGLQPSAPAGHVEQLQPTTSTQPFRRPLLFSSLVGLLSGRATVSKR